MDLLAEETARARLAQVYNETVADHIIHPRNLGEISDADGFGKITGPCGDTMEIWVKVRNGIITQAGFATDGCGATVANGSMITEMARGKSVTQAMRISQQDVLEAINGLPEDHEHCALLASNTLKEALQDYLTFKKEPWKRAYRKY